MDIYASDEEKVEALKTWWKENGRALILGLVLGLAAVFGWRGWVQHQQTQAEQASALYAQVKVALQQENAEALQERATHMFREFADSPYAILTALAAAKVELAQDRLDAARGHLQWAVDHAQLSGLRHVARIRLARILLAQGDTQAASNLVSGAEWPAAFASEYEELRGDVLRQQGRAEDARAAYEKALTTLPDASGKRQLMKLKLQAVSAGSTQEQGS